MTEQTESLTPEERFWRDPPWRGGRTQFRLGLSQIAEDEWLDAPIDEGERARKRRLLETRRDAVVRRVPGFEALEAAAAGFVAGVLRGRGVPAPEAPATLEALALTVPDDLCLLAPSAEGHRLVAACLCAPSYWRLGEKIGKTMPGVHGPVPGLNDAVGDMLQRFFDNLPAGRVFRRRNFLIHQSDEPFHPEDERWELPVTPARCPSLFVRSETQTLRRVPDDGVLFTIRVQSLALGGIARHPQAAADLLAAMDRMSDNERRAFGAAHHGVALRQYLTSIINADADS
ncbi:MAG: DUF3445 domain-containing protein [Pseudomonadales bacterium]